MLTRHELLSRGAAAGAGLLTAPIAARGAAPARPAPAGDDIGFLQFAVLAERTGLAVARRARRQAHTWTPAERRGLTDAARDKVVHVQRLTAALGADAPSVHDFAVRLPRRAFRTRAGALRLGLRVERLLVGVLISAVAATSDPATRLLLGRVLARDAGHLAALRAMAGLDPAAGLPAPLGLAAAGERLDTLLRATGYPTA